MDNETEVIRQQMEDTRASLTEKLGNLEQQVVGTVQDTTTAVAETVENVKEGVQETVESVKNTMQEAAAAVKETFDIRLQTERHPWLMFGGSVAVGYLAGYLWKRSDFSQSAVPGWSPSQAPPDHSWPRAAEHDLSAYRPASQAAPPPRTEPEEPGWLTQLGSTFRPELDQLKGLAIGAALGLVRDMVARSLPPQMGSQLHDVIDNMTSKLGGKPVQGPILERFEGTSRPGSEYERAHATEAGTPRRTAF